jgi:AcrR family transcriptional regulator
LTDNGNGSRTGTRSSTSTEPRRSRENTRARLVEAAADVFAAKPLGRVTVDDLVGAAGFSRGAFYSNYSTIEDLFFDVYAHQADLMLAEVSAAVDAVPPDSFDLESVGVIFAALTPFGRRWFPLHNEFTLLAVRDAGARARFGAHVEEFQHRIEELVTRVLLLLGRRPVVSDEHISDVLLALYLHSLGAELLGTGGLPPDRLVAEVLPHVLMGLSTPRA